MTTRTTPPTRRSTSASLVAQPTSACHQRRITSSLVHASKTRSAGAWNVRSMRSVLVSVTSGPPVVGVAAGALPGRGPRASRCPCRRAWGGAPPPARAPRGRGSRPRAPRAALRGGRCRERRFEDGRLVVLVVEVPPPVGRGLRVALGRVLPLL